MVSRYSVIFLAAIFLSGCRPATPPPTPLDQTQQSPVPITPFGASQAPQTPSPAPDYVARMRNAQYQLGIPDSLQVVQLIDGQRCSEGGNGNRRLLSLIERCRRGCSRPT